MTEFVLELYVSRIDLEAVGAGDARARQAAEELSREGLPVRFLRTLYLPEEETCFYLFEAESVAQVEEVARRAGVSFERVAAAMSEPGS